MVSDQLAHCRVGDPVRRMHDGRREATGKLVLAAGAGLETPQSFAQTVGDSLVETQLEMQAVIVAAASPLAAIQGLVSAETERHLSLIHI